MTNTNHTYRGPLKAVVLDWAGTTVDYGCMAPAAVFIETFKRRGITITMAQARGPMGMFKKDHIRAIAQMEPVAQQWLAVHDLPITEDDVNAMYHDFLPLQLAVIARACRVIPGTLEAIAAFRQRGLKIGSTTGYTRAIMDRLSSAVRPARLQARCDLVCRRSARRPATAVDDVSERTAVRCLSDERRGQDRRHRARHRRGLECGRVDDWGGEDRQ